MCLFAQLCLTAEFWTVACQAPLSIGFFRQESGLSVPSPQDLPALGMEPSFSVTLLLQEDSLLAEPLKKSKDKSINNV